MKNITNRFFYALLLIGIFGLYACSEQLEVSPEKASSVQTTPVDASPASTQNCVYTCENCDNLITNGSFETFTGSLGSTNALSITNNTVPPWYEVRGTPNIMNGTLPMTSSMYTNPGFDGTNILHMNENPFQNPDLGEAAAINVNVRSDADLTYCLSFRYALGIRLFDNQPNPPGQVEARLANGVPQSTQKPEIDWTTYTNQLVGTATTSTTWQTSTYQFSASQNYSQLILDAQAVNQGSGNVTRVLVDDVQLSCQTDALQGINITQNADGTITLSADLQGLPANVTIVSYEWCGISAGPNSSTVTIPAPSQAIDVCLKIKDSRGCCASVCEKIEIVECDSLKLSSCCTINVGSGGIGTVGGTKNREAALQAISASGLRNISEASPFPAVCDPCIDGWYPVWVEDAGNNPVGIPGDPCYVVEWFDDQGNLLYTGWSFPANVDQVYTVRVTDTCKDCVWEEKFSYSCCTTPEKPRCTIDRRGFSVLSWNPVPGATGYQVQITVNDPNCCRKTTSLPYSLPLIDVSSTSYTPQLSYFCASWSVRAICGDGTYSDFTASQCICNQFSKEDEEK
ncbi:MAG: hypothetical protein AAFP89_08435 [Bacteroidota bacterium]